MQLTELPEGMMIVDLAKVPELPITYENMAEYPYAVALGQGIVNGNIDGPGKYAISAVAEGDNVIYTIYSVHE